MNETKNDKRSLLMLMSSMLIFGTIGIFRRYIPLSSALLAFIRGAIGSAFLVLFLKIRKEKLDFSFGWSKIVLLVVTGGMIGFNWILLFEAYNYTTIATATLCYYMQPTIVILLSPLIFKERLTKKKGICAAVAVIGMLFVSGMVESGIPQIGEAKGILFGLGAAALYATVVILNKMLSGVGAYEKTVLQLASAAIVLIPYLIFTQDFSNISLDGKAVIMILIVGFVHTGIAYALYFGSIEKLRAQTVAVFSYIDPISALLLSALFLHESMSIYEVIGTILILGATAISELSIRRNEM